VIDIGLEKFCTGVEVIFKDKRKNEETETFLPKSLSTYLVQN